ncbi:outer membrane beta-barrel protein [Psychroflexus sp. ALD_RP9]|uniref:outer membrane beta-barrel protein n=1 Tax=Psychroflexus sp. ALD_RP9 TaxID=2777186 RepID=UPI001A8D2B4B|nr:outer membrane beta-barrel protein [Psychroflexus sp. ALD_RP9]QSS97180.1 outer membrane beta-barrel protein [Psychroflexus sp. ALD_RP9]
MKKLLLLVAVLIAGISANAQEGIEKGTILVEANTGNAMVGTTSFSFASSDGSTEYSFGLDGGYFVMDNLAIKVGLGYQGLDPDLEESTSAFSYRIGAKYYIANQFPVTLDLTGASGDAVENFNGDTPLWLGIGGGYAWFVTENISIEPGLRYNYSLNEDFTDEGIFQFNIGFALFF